MKINYNIIIKVIIFNFITIIIIIIINFLFFIIIKKLNTIFLLVYIKILRSFCWFLFSFKNIKFPSNHFKSQFDFDFLKNYVIWSFLVKSLKSNQYFYFIKIKVVSKDDLFC